MGESFKDLAVWQRAIQMTIAVYKATESFPPDERFRLTNQLRRASVSVASNIAEGYGRATTGEYLQFLGHARGSLFECETQLIIARGLNFIPDTSMDEVEKLRTEVSRMLIALMKTIHKDPKQSKRI